MKTVTLKKDNESKKKLWNRGYPFRAVSGFCCPVLHLSIQFKCFGWLLHRLWWTTLSATDLCFIMHLELKPAETENFKKEKAFMSLLRYHLTRKVFPPPPTSLEAFPTYFPFINHLSSGKPTGISLFSLPFVSRHWLWSCSHLRPTAPRGWDSDLRTERAIMLHVLTLNRNGNFNQISTIFITTLILKAHRSNQGQSYNEGYTGNTKLDPSLRGLTRPDFQGSNSPMTTTTKETTFRVSTEFLKLRFLVFFQ